MLKTSNLGIKNNPAYKPAGTKTATYSLEQRLTFLQNMLNDYRHRFYSIQEENRIGLSSLQTQFRELELLIKQLHIPTQNNK